MNQLKAVISTKLFAGRTVVHVYSATEPGADFEPAEPGLKNVYFSTLAGHIGRRREQPNMTLREVFPMDADVDYWEGK